MFDVTVMALSKVAVWLTGKAGGEHGNQHTGGKVNNVNFATASKGNTTTYALRKLRKVTTWLTGRPGNPTGANQHSSGIVNNVNNSKRSVGNNATYALRKLRKDAPASKDTPDV